MLQTRDLTLHGLRSLLSIAALLVAAHQGQLVGVIVFTLATFLALFSFQHDLIHGALGLPARLREPALALVGSLMLLSGHGTRVMHLHHHQRTFAGTDLEGLTARLPLMTALLRAPALMVGMRLDGYRRAGRTSRRWQRLELALNLLALLTLALVPTTWPILVTVLLLQVSMPIWAGRIPHRAPRQVVELARRLAFTLSPTLLSLAFHELHHRRPRIPTHGLYAYARRVTR